MARQALPRPIPVYTPLMRQHVLLSPFLCTPTYAPLQVFTWEASYGCLLADWGSGSVWSDAQLCSWLRPPAGSGAVNALYLLGGLVALALAGYLVYALLRAEDF